jgi:lipopolysaccharide export system permease protein
MLSLASLNFILMMEKLLRLSRFLSGVGTSVIDMGKIIVYLQPQLFLLTIPMSLLLSTLLVYGRLNVDNELIIMKISGMNFRSIITPVAVLGIFCFMLNTAVSFYLGPESSVKLRDEITHIIKMRTPLAIEEGRFNTSFKDILIYVSEKPSDTKVRDIFIYDSRNRKEPKVLIAKEGLITTQEDFTINFFLREGYMNMVGGDSITEVYFAKYNMLLSLESDAPSKKNSELTPYELWQRINMVDQRFTAHLYLELNRRFSLPLLCIILILFGPPLALMAGKAGKLGGLALGLAVFTGYYMVLIYAENLVRAGKIPHYAGSWIPTVLFITLALIFFRRASSR